MLIKWQINRVGRTFQPFTIKQIIFKCVKVRGSRFLIGLMPDNTQLTSSVFKLGIDSETASCNCQNNKKQGIRENLRLKVTRQFKNQRQKGARYSYKPLASKYDHSHLLHIHQMPHHMPSETEAASKCGLNLARTDISNVRNI